MENKKFFGILLHLSHNMWADRTQDELSFGYNGRETYLKCDEDVWDESVKYAAECGFNAVVIDLGDGVQYESHPEIAIDGAWSVAKLKSKLDDIRALGMEPIPKLNFSTSHDAWLGEYHRMVSTKIYYDVVKDLIDEVIDIFGTPTYFHLGCDEERVEEQAAVNAYFSCFRRGKLLWDDLNFYFNCVKKHGVTPWIWSDHFWYNRDEFVKNIGRDVVLSPWYYDNMYGSDVPPDTPLRPLMLEGFRAISDEGYIQIPCGSNCWRSSGIRQLMHYVTQETQGKGIQGFLLAPWERTYREFAMSIKEGIYLANYARKDYDIFK